MKKYVVSFVLLFLFDSCNSKIEEKVVTRIEKKAFQNAPFQLLVDGYFKGYNSVNELASKGDFGLGVYHDMNGELILIDGIFYRVDYGGKVEKAQTYLTVPYITMTYFKPDARFTVSKKMSSRDFLDYLNKSIDPKKIYAIRIEGFFNSLKLCAPRTPKRIGATLEEVIKDRAVFNTNNPNGVAVGFYFPKHYKGVNIPGFHFHYISSDKKYGGHLMDFAIKNIQVQLQIIKSLEVNNPSVRKSKKDSKTILKPVEY